MDNIKRGDMVNVYWEHVQCETGLIVLYTPSEAGDSWILARSDGTPVHINNFCKLIRTGKAAQPQQEASHD